MLSKRDAALRVAALNGIYRARMWLDGGFEARDAGRAAMYNHPRTALLRIARAEAQLQLAKKALRKWAKKS